MGRQIKRVALDFAWPLKEVWQGYVNPHYRECPTCRGKARTAGREWLESIVHLLLTAGEDAQSGRPLHPWLLFGNAPSEKPTPDLAELTTGLAGRAPRGAFGHDACDRWTAIDKIVAAAGLSDKWGWCPTCAGNGQDPATKVASDAWQRTEPPAGEGWQVWETVSEGSPISPVFAHSSRLVEWLMQSGYSRDAAEAFVRGGYVPSMVLTGGVLYRDIESAALISEQQD